MMNSTMNSKIADGLIGHGLISPEKLSNKTMFTVLHGFFNLIGADRFYLKKYVLGVLKIVLALFTFYAYEMSKESIFKMLLLQVPVSSALLWVKTFIVSVCLTIIWFYVDLLSVIANTLEKSLVYPFVFGKGRFDPKTTEVAFKLSVALLLELCVSLYILHDRYMPYYYLARVAFALDIEKQKQNLKDFVAHWTWW